MDANRNGLLTVLFEPYRFGIQLASGWSGQNAWASAMLRPGLDNFRVKFLRHLLVSGSLLLGEFIELVLVDPGQFAADPGEPGGTQGTVVPSTRSEMS